MAIPKDDWRRQGQERSLAGVALVRRFYRENPRNETWGHDHCEFCGTRFSPTENPVHLKEGYTTETDYHWICVSCYNDFRDEYGWTVLNEEHKEIEHGDSDNLG